MVCTLVELVRSARVGIGAHARTLSVNVSKSENEEDQRLIQGIIPDMVIYARGRINGGTFPDNPLGDRVSLIEHKTLASMKMMFNVISKSVERTLIPVTLARLLRKNSHPMANTLS